MEEKRAFKGIWIPSYIWTNPNLQPHDIHIWGEIDSFTHNDGLCFASNRWLSDKFKCSIRHIQRSLQRLVNEELIEIEFKGNPKTKETQRLIRSIQPKTTPRLSSHTPMTEQSYPHDSPVIHNNNQYNNNQNKESKSHSVQFSEKENSHGESDSFSLSKNIGKKSKEPKDPNKPKEVWDKYRLTEKEYKSLMTFHAGFCEEIDKHAQVRYDKNFNHLAGLYRDSGKKIETLKSVYSYFRTFRDFNDTFTLEIRSLRALREKYGKLIVECRKKTAEYIETRKTCILAVNHEKNYVVIYMNENISVSDQIKIASFVQSGYKIIDISPGIDPIDLKKIGYISSGGSKF